MATAIENALTEEQLVAFCKELRDLPGKDRSFRGIQAVAKRWGIFVSHEAAGNFKKTVYQRQLEKLNASRETREALCAAAGAGVHPLNAIEEALVIELQDHLSEAQTIDVAFVTKQVLSLRQAISMREDGKRKDRESDKKIEVADQQIERLKEQNAKLVSDRESREATLREKATAAGAALNKPKASADEIRAQTVALIDEIMGIKPKAKKA